VTANTSDPAAPAGPGQTGLLARISHWAVVRLLVYIVVLVGALVVTTVLTNPLIPAAASPQRHLALLIRNLVSPVMLLALYALAVRLMEHRPASEVGLRAGGPSLAVGAVVGTLLMSTVYGVLWGLGLARFGPGDGLDGLLGGLVVAFAAAVLEELLLRAVLFRILEEVSGTTVAVVVSAAIFGLLHAVNPGATPVSTAAVAIEAGVLLALAYALTHNLWLAIGIHMAWNFTEGSLYGAAVSGGQASHSLIKATLTGPELLTGGAFGPEASVVSVGVCLTAAAIIGMMIVRRRGWRPLGFRLRLA
jgi:membrane protease YdiL (CAAX protease family)